MSPLGSSQSRNFVSHAEPTPKIRNLAHDGSGRPEDSFEKSLGNCKNPYELQFFEAAQARKQPRVTRALRYNDGTGRLRWYVIPRIQEAYVVQKGRFTKDEDFWRSRLSPPSSAHPLDSGA